MPRAWNAILWLPLVLFAGCAGGWAIDAGRDGGDAALDSGRRDAGPRDAGSDGGPRDAGRDAGPAPDPDWLPIAGLPAECEIEVARDPAVVPPLRFEPCPGREGCRRIVVDWTPLPRSRVRLGFSERSALDDEHSYFGWSRPSPDSPHWYRVVSRDDGRVLFATRRRVRVPVDCSMTEIALTPRTYAFAVIYIGPDGPLSFPVRARFDAPVESWASVEPRPVMPFFAQKTLTSDTTTVFHVAGGAEYRYGPDGAIEHLRAPGTFGVRDVVGDVVIGESYTDRWRLVTHSADPESPSLLWEWPDAGAANAHWHDGVLAWYRLTEEETYTRYGRVELYTSPLPDFGATLTPQRVTRIPTNGLGEYVGVGAGRLWNLEGVSEIGLYDLRTGEHRRYTSPPDRRCQGAPVLGPFEAAFPVQFLNARTGLELETVEFVQYDQLPVVPGID